MNIELTKEEIKIAISQYVFDIVEGDVNVTVIENYNTTQDVNEYSFNLYLEFSTPLGRR